MKVVLDTNVFVASFLNPAGTPRKIIDLWKDGRIVLCLCAEIIEEYIDVLSRFGLESEKELEELLEVFRKKVHIHFVAIDRQLKLVTADPEDDKFVECAMSAQATVVVSGDKHLLDLKRYKSIRMLSPSQFISFLQQQSEN
ncbi:MAG: putative toxin-antitoxin system toxin component, PIN family [Thermodesulfovibrionales bacterium]|nr:putative toxin-antitoxin system toxin component, PIN family [Thermodesulfovibrionales bacterium]